MTNPHSVKDKYGNLLLEVIMDSFPILDLGYLSFVYAVVKVFLEYCFHDADFRFHDVLT